MINRTESKIYAWLAALCFAAWSCGGDGGSPISGMPEVPAHPDGFCTVTPHTIDISPVDASVTPLTRSATGEPGQKATYAANLGHNYSAEATLEAVPQEVRTRAGANLEADARYRIVVFDGTGTVVGNVVYKAGSSEVVSGNEIKLQEGTYRLFAYTFNSASDIRALDADNKNVTVNSGEDFMTCTNANFTVTSAEYSGGKQLDISFVRQCARLTVTIVAEAYTDNTISAASLTIGNVFANGSKWNGITNTDASVLPSAAGTAALTKASGNAESVDCGLAANNPYLITPPCSDQTISVSGLNVTIGGVAKTPADIHIPTPVTLAKGGSYKLTLYIGNYYVLTRTNPVTIGGVKWARTNLEQTGSGDSAPISFVANPWDYGSHWNWGIRDATQYGSNVYPTEAAPWNNSTAGHANQDPCRSLGSGWRLPTKGDMNSLTNNPAPSGTKVKINGAVNTTVSKGWAPDAKGTVCKSGNQVVYLPAAGQRSQTGNTNNTGSNGYYWAATQESGYAASDLYFNSGSLSVSMFSRVNGQSLRCVQD